MVWWQFAGIILVQCICGCIRVPFIVVCVHWYAMAPSGLDSRHLAEFILHSATRSCGRAAPLIQVTLITHLYCQAQPHMQEFVHGRAHR